MLPLGYYKNMSFGKFATSQFNSFFELPATSFSIYLHTKYHRVILFLIETKSTTVHVRNVHQCNVRQWNMHWTSRPKRNDSTGLSPLWRFVKRNLWQFDTRSQCPEILHPLLSRGEVLSLGTSRPPSFICFVTFSPALTYFQPVFCWPFPIPQHFLLFGTFWLSILFSFSHFLAFCPCETLYFWCDLLSMCVCVCV